MKENTMMKQEASFNLTAWLILVAQFHYDDPKEMFSEQFSLTRHMNYLHLSKTC